MISASSRSARLALTGTLALLAALPGKAQTPPTTRLTVDMNARGVAVSPTMHGLFFEDINYAADGGLYAELVQNRSFEHNDALYAWSPEKRESEGEVRVVADYGLNAMNPHFLRLQIRNVGKGFGVTNTGYDGIAVKQGESYLFSIHARANGGFQGLLTAILEDESGQPLGQCQITGLTPQWKKFEGKIPSVATTTKARLVVLAQGTGQVDLDMVSLFPENTWKKRRNGLRADLVQILADMKPGFLRFPGGCIVEGRDLENAYRWKDTIGDVAERRQNANLWQEANAPQYYQTYGLGFFEYFQLCEDIGAEPVPIVNCGMICQFRGGTPIPLSMMDSYIQDALDLIEFANGPVTSTWGAKRAAMGHPAPFNLKFIGVGNEQWGEDYFVRYPLFYKAIKARYPKIQIITTAGPGVDDRWWNLAWGKFKSGTPAEIVDEHYYRPPQWFLSEVDRYDNYDRKGARVFAGEYASHASNRRNTLGVALTEAAYMTGLVRNADVVSMAAYAPLFAKVGHMQWQPDLIWFDNTRVYGSPSYYVQAMYSRNRPDVALPVQVSASRPVTPVYRGMVGVGTWLTQAEYKDVTVIQNGKTLYSSNFAQGSDGWKTSRGRWEVVDGALRQSGDGQNVLAVVGDPSWSDYTLSLKARKLGGNEGFLVLFQHPGDDSTNWWNLGGWNNQEHGLQVEGLPETRIPGRIETGRWYDIRVELQGPSIKCYLDGKLIQEATRKPSPAVFAVAGRDNKTGETLIKVVNVSGEAIQAEVDLRGVRQVEPNGKAIVLTSASPSDENTLENPTRVAPREEAVTLSGPTFTRTLPANSFTILRIKARK